MTRHYPGKASRAETILAALADEQLPQEVRDTLRAVTEETPYERVGDDGRRYPIAGPKAHAAYSASVYTQHATGGKPEDREGVVSVWDCRPARMQ